MSSLDYSRCAVMRDLASAYDAIVDAGLPAADARTCLETVVARMPADPFEVGGIAVYFADLDREVRGLSADARNMRLVAEFGSDGVRGALILCRRFALAPEGVAL